jgi:DNA-binding NarL/FixJ family response regulator
VAFRILIADDHPTIRKVLRSLIESHEEWQVCGEVENGSEAVAKARELKPDLVILDLAMPVMDGIRAAREISRAIPGMPILMHTMHGSPAVNLEAKKAGVTLVVSKGESGNNLIGAITELLKAGESRAAGGVVNLAETAVSAVAAGAETIPAQAEKADDAPAAASETEEPPRAD